MYCVLSCFQKIYFLNIFTVRPRVTGLLVPKKKRVSLKPCIIGFVKTDVSQKAQPSTAQPYKQKKFVENRKIETSRKINKIGYIFEK